MIKEDNLNKILNRIKTIKIQGATNIAKAGIKAYLLEPTNKNAKRIINTRLTEPLLQNSIKILTKAKNKKECANKLLLEIEESHQEIPNYGIDLIKKDMNIFSHCHSSTVIDILCKAKKKRIKFVVYTVEVEPKRQGRMTAKELEKEGIKIVIGPDLAMEQLIRNCDLILFGADAFTKTSVYNKIGTETICRLGKQYNIPVYACGVAMKYSKKVKIENRSGKEVWDERKKNIKTIYPAFDKVNYKLVTGIISEFGILKPKEFIKKAKIKLKQINKKY